jgi:hypothetical protein
MVNKGSRHSDSSDIGDNSNKRDASSSRIQSTIRMSAAATLCSSSCKNDLKRYCDEKIKG